MDGQYDSSWTKEARERFEDVVAAHGGWAAWSAVERIDFELTQFSGALLFLKGYPRSFVRPGRVSVLPHERVVTFEYPTHRDKFEDGRVTFGVEQQVLANGRVAFSGATFERWHALHATYFFGYAWANYLSYPFILPNHQLLRCDVRPRSSSFTIAFNSTFHTHSEVQEFYFGPDHLLRRHDYRAALAGPLVYGAHLTQRYTAHQGLQVALTRIVFPRAGRVPLPIKGITGELRLCANP